MAGASVTSNTRTDGGKPSFNAFKKQSPQFAAYNRHVAKIEKTGEREPTEPSPT